MEHSRLRGGQVSTHHQPGITVYGESRLHWFDIKELALQNSAAVASVVMIDFASDNSNHQAY